MGRTKVKEPLLVFFPETGLSIEEITTKKQGEEETSRLYGNNAYAAAYQKALRRVIFPKMGSHAAGGLGQTSHLAALTGAGGEEFVHFFQLVAGVLGQDAHHRSDPVLAVVVLKEVENLLMVFVQIGNPFGFLHVLQPFRAPLMNLSRKPSSSTSKVLPL